MRRGLMDLSSLSLLALTKGKAKMTCHYCKSIAKKRRTKQGIQRFRCRFCKKTFCENHERPLDKMRIKLEDVVLALKCLVERKLNPKH